MRPTLKADWMVEARVQRLLGELQEASILADIEGHGDALMQQYDEATGHAVRGDFRSALLVLTASPR